MTQAATIEHGGDQITLVANTSFDIMSAASNIEAFKRRSFRFNHARKEWYKHINRAELSTWVQEAAGFGFDFFIKDAAYENVTLHMMTAATPMNADLRKELCFKFNRQTKRYEKRVAKDLVQAALEQATARNLIVRALP